MQQVASAEVRLEKLAKLIKSVVNAERQRLIAERDFLTSVQKTYEAGTSTKDAQVAAVLEYLGDKIGTA